MSASLKLFVAWFDGDDTRVKPFTGNESWDGAEYGVEVVLIVAPNKADAETKAAKYRETMATSCLTWSRVFDKKGRDVSDPKMPPEVLS